MSKNKQGQRNLFQVVTSIVLCFALLCTNVIVFADNTTNNKAQTKDSVYVTIEDYSTGKFILEPKEVELTQDMGGSISVSNAMKTAFKDGSIKISMDGPMFEMIVKSVKLKDGTVIENNDINNWVVFAKSNKVSDLDFAPRLSKDNVVRLIYCKKDNSDIGLNGNKLSVNKDVLISKLGSLTDEDKKDENISEIYKKSLELILDKNATEEQINTKLKEIDSIINKPIPAQKIDITPSNAKVYVGKKINLTAQKQPENSTDAIKWSTENIYIADVDENGVVTGKNAGEVNIVARAGNVEAKAKITVEDVKVERIYFKKDNVKVTQWGKTKLDLVLEPENTTDKVKLTSQDEEIVEVDSIGNIIGKKVGKTKVIATCGKLTAECDVEVEKRTEFTEPTVVFKYDNGEIKEADEDGVFTLTSLDIGNFVFEGAKDIEFLEGKPYWDCSDKITQGVVSKTNIWITADGKYQPYEPKTVNARVLDRSPALGGEKVIKEFKIRCVETDVQELKGYIDGKEIDSKLPFSLAGSETKRIDIKGKLKGTQEYIDIPVQALKYSESTGYGYINRGLFGMNTGLDIPQNAVAKFDVSMSDKTANFRFDATSQKVDVVDMNIGVPDSAYIDEWNALAEQYVGVFPVIGMTPQNATNQKTEWEALTPDIAEYQYLHNNGIVPKKAGIAKFKVRASDNKNIVRDIAIDFKYKNPLTNMTIDNKDISIEQFKEIELPMNPIPENATEQRFNWTYDKEGIVEVKDSIYKESTHNVNSKTITSHKLIAKNIGTVKVTGTPFDNTANCKSVEFTVTVKPKSNTEIIDYVSLAKENIEHGNKYIKELPYSEYGYEWNLFTLLRTGASVSKTDINNYVNSAVKTMKENTRLQPTDYARIVLTLGASGHDINNVQGIDIAKILYSNQNLSRYSSNQLIWTLIALDSKESKIPENAEWTREKLVKEILLYQAEDGSFGLTKTQPGSVDVTAMALQALASYYKDSVRENLGNQISDETKDNVEKAVVKSLDYLKSKITVNGGFIEGGEENACTMAQVVTGMTALKMDPTTTEGFTFGNKNMINNFSKFKRDKGFAYLDKQESDEMGTIQTVYALNSYVRFVNGEDSLYDLTNVKSENTTPNPNPTPKPEVKPETEQKPIVPNTQLKPQENNNENSVENTNSNNQTINNKENSLIAQTSDNLDLEFVSIIMLLSFVSIYIVRRKTNKR